VQTDVYGNPFSFWRRVWRDGVMREECWQESKNIWVARNGRLLWMQISGECTLQVVSQDLFEQLVLKAYLEKEESK
jgi:hypothetical protein